MEKERFLNYLVMFKNELGALSKQMFEWGEDTENGGTLADLGFNWSYELANIGLELGYSSWSFTIKGQSFEDIKNDFYNMVMENEKIVNAYTDDELEKIGERIKKAKSNIKEYTISIERADLDRYNSLLSLDLEENAPYYNKAEIERLGAKNNDYIGIISKDLGKDYVLTIDLASGDSNYYDNIVVWKKVKNELIENEILECEYSLGKDFEITLENDEKCLIKWKII